MCDNSQTSRPIQSINLTGDLYHQFLDEAGRGGLDDLLLFLRIVDEGNRQRTNAISLSNEQLAEDLRWGKRRVSRSRKRLTSNGFIRRLAQRDDKTGEFTGHRIEILWTFPPIQSVRKVSGISTEGGALDDR